MLWFEAADFRRRLAAGTGLAAMLLLSGCIQPLYGTLNGQLREELQAIAVDPIPDRLGHYLGNELIFAFNGTGSEVVPKYRLLVTLAEHVQTPLVDTFAGRASAATVTVDANFQLLPVNGGAAIIAGTAISAASYDRSAQRFANVRAARDAEIRNAKTLADQIRTRVSAALANHP